MVDSSTGLSCNLAGFGANKASVRTQKGGFFTEFGLRWSILIPGLAEIWRVLIPGLGIRWSILIPGLAETWPVLGPVMLLEGVPMVFNWAYWAEMFNCWLDCRFSLEYLFYNANFSCFSCVEKDIFSSHHGDIFSVRL